MKYFKLSLILLFACCSCLSLAQGKREYYQLKTYSFEKPDNVARVDAFLKNAYIPALHRQGISSVGVFKIIPNEEDSLIKILVLIPFETMDKFVALESALLSDQAYQKAGTSYINAKHDNAPYVRIESVLMKAFKDMSKMAKPKLKGSKSERVYELRSYESATEKIYVNKVDMFNAGGEVILFDKLGFNAVFYAEVLSGPRMPNLMYMTTFDNMESRDAHWKDFVNAPEWKKMSSLDKYQNNVSTADIWLLYPTEYSDY